MLGVRRAASRLEVARTTIYAWIAQKRLLEWQSKPRGLTISAAQILGPRWVVPGLGVVIDIAGNVELALGFLIHDWELEDAAAPPLDLLTTGRTGDVINAAARYSATLS